ncbi:MAG: nucleotide exchange factor GrpE [Gammaproteobacteria bacterium]|nr:MAG: nucleotide exchange factor GrpE [Gammaproteobacteria bacterium]
MSNGDQNPHHDEQPPQNQDKAEDGVIDETGQAENVSSEAEDVSDAVAQQEELLQAKDQVLRVQAEMQNLRRRVDRDIENAHKYALEGFLVELLPVVDNLERALAAIDSSDETQKTLSEGIELTLKSFLDVLTRNKVEQLDPVEQSFDPEFHQAMTMVPHPEVPNNTIIEVFQKGYLLNGRLVRPAMVVVSKGA